MKYRNYNNQQEAPITLQHQRNHKLTKWTIDDYKEIMWCHYYTMIKQVKITSVKPLGYGKKEILSHHGDAKNSLAETNYHPTNSKIS